MEQSIDRLIICQELYSKILNELKTTYTSSWDVHKTVFHFFLKDEIVEFQNYLEQQNSPKPVMDHWEFAGAFNTRLQNVILETNEIPASRIEPVSNTITEIMHYEVQRQLFHSAMPFSIH